MKQNERCSRTRHKKNGNSSPQDFKSHTMASTDASFSLLMLPDAVIYHVLTFIAEPTRRTHVICHKLAPLSKNIAASLLEDREALWDCILGGDYGYSMEAGEEYRLRPAKRSRREVVVKRLKRAPLERVKREHLKVQTYPAKALSIFSKLGQLSEQKVLKDLKQYGPFLKMNKPPRPSLLMNCLEAAGAEESAILACVKELVERHGADVNSKVWLAAPLCVATGRAMPLIVEYLLEKGASKNVRHRWHSAIRLDDGIIYPFSCDNETPLEFARRVQAAARLPGLGERDSSGINRCIQLLDSDNAG